MNRAKFEKSLFYILQLKLAANLYLNRIQMKVVTLNLTQIDFNLFSNVKHLIRSIRCMFMISFRIQEL